MPTSPPLHRDRRQTQWVKSSPALSRRERFFWAFPRMGHGLGQNKARKNEPLQKVQKTEKTRHFYKKTAGN